MPPPCVFIIKIEAKTFSLTQRQHVFILGNFNSPLAVENNQKFNEFECLIQLKYFLLLLFFIFRDGWFGKGF